MNTRFNPTANGPLHIGHIYMALLNEGMAHESGGKFHVRFDDNAPHFMRGFIRQIPGVGWATPEKAHIQLEELEWAGLEIDSVSSQTEMEEEINKFLASRDFRWGSGVVGYGYSTVPIVTNISPPEGFILHVRHAVEKVVSDYRDGSDVLIRGTEWLVEHHLYMYFCALFGFRFPKCYYVPRLIMARDVARGRGAASTVEDVSKTIGNWSVPELRAAGVSPSQMRSELRESCLVNPTGLWDVGNLKDQPRLASREVEDVLRR